MLDSAVFDRHIRRMRTLLAALSSAAVLTLGMVPAQAQTPVQQAQAPNPQVAEVERYFNSIRTMQARFVQSNPGGTVVQGTLSVSGPAACASNTIRLRS